MIPIKRNYQKIKQALDKFKLFNYFDYELYHIQHDSYNPFLVHSTHDVLNLDYLFLFGVMWIQGYVFDFFDGTDHDCMKELLALKMIAIKRAYKWTNVPHPESYCECYLTPIGEAYIRSIGLDKILDSTFEKPYSYKPPVINLPDKSTMPKLSKLQIHYGLFKLIVIALEILICFILMLLSSNITLFSTLFLVGACFISISYFVIKHFDRRPELRRWKANYPYPYHVIGYPLDEDSHIVRLEKNQSELVEHYDLLSTIKSFASEHSNDTRISILRILYRYKMLSRIKQVDFVVDAMKYNMFKDKNWLGIDMWYPFLIT